MKSDLESRISKLEKLILYKSRLANRILEKNTTELELTVNHIENKFVYIIHSTMTDDNFYFISDDKLKLKSLVNKITDLFMESVYCEDDDKHDLLFDQLMDLCNTNNIQYVDDIYENPIVTYAEYLDSIGIDPYEDEYDQSIDLDEKIIIDNNNPYTFEVVGKHRSRF